MILTSKNNPLIKATASLKEKKGRKELGSFLVEGVKMATECIRSGFAVEYVFVEENHTFIPQEVGFAQEQIVYVSKDVMRYLSDEKTPQGILCRVKIPQTELSAPKGNWVGTGTPARLAKKRRLSRKVSSSIRPLPWGM